MTFRAQPVTRRKRRSPFQDDQRQQLLVTIGFIALIVIALLILAGAVGATYYGDHLANVATVDGTGITKDQWNDRQKVDAFRIAYLISRLQEAQAAGQIDANTVNQEISYLQQQQSSLPSNALTELIDQTLQSKLAAQNGVSVTNADVDAQLKVEATTPERRKVLLIAVAPKLATGETTATAAEKQTAQDNANKALADLKAGKAFADVAKQYSTDSTASKGGDDGYITSKDTSQDPAFLTALFALPLNGTTDVIAGADGTYRIGRVTDIIPEKVDSSYQDEIKQTVSLDAYRSAVRGDVIRTKLQDKILADATTGQVDQVHGWEIKITTTDSSGSPIVGSEVKASHILFSPKGDPSNASKVPATDPSWNEAKQKADQVAAQLRAITDPTKRAEEFATLAKSDSNDTSSGANGGDLGWFGNGSMVKEFNDAVFNGAHQPYEIIGPVKTQFGWHVIMYVASRESPENRIKAVEAALAKPDADFAALAKQYSDATDADQGGDMGWIAHYQIDTSVESILFGLQAGKVSQAITQSDATYFYKVSERQKRAVDATQESTLKSNAYNNWYAEQKAKATIWESPDVQGASAG